MKLIFETGTNGITKIINGSIRDIDRDTYTDIESVSKVVIDPLSFNTYAIDNELKAVQIGGFVIFFDDLINWEPYFNQIDLFDGELVDPHKGVKDPLCWDKGAWDAYTTDKSDNVEVELLTNPTGNFETQILN